MDGLKLYIRSEILMVCEKSGLWWPIGQDRCHEFLLCLHTEVDSFRLLSFNLFGLHFFDDLNRNFNIFYLFNLFNYLYDFLFDDWLLNHFLNFSNYDFLNRYFYDYLFDYFFNYFFNHLNLFLNNHFFDLLHFPVHNLFNFNFNLLDLLDNLRGKLSLTPFTLNHYSIFISYLLAR